MKQTTTALQRAAIAICKSIAEGFPDGQFQPIPTWEDAPEPPPNQRKKPGKAGVTLDAWFDLDGEELKAKQQEVFDFVRDSLPAWTNPFRHRVKFNVRGRLSVRPDAQPNPMTSRKRAEVCLERWAMMRDGGRLKTARPDGLETGGDEPGSDIAAQDYRLVQEILEGVSAAELVADVVEQLHYEGKQAHAFRADARHLRMVVRAVFQEVQEHFEKPEQKVFDVMEPGSPPVITTFREVS